MDRTTITPYRSEQLIIIRINYDFILYLAKLIIMRNVFAKNIPDEEVADPSGWIIDNAFAQFVMMNTVAIQYMCMVRERDVENFLLKLAYQN